jgi:CubicO group peptidase (beta-lactamase class C family)
LLLTAALLMTRPWSRQNSWRQMRIFSPSVRVQNFRAMGDLFPARPVHRGPSPHRFDIREKPLPTTYAFRGQSRSLAEFIDRTTTTGLLVLQDDAIVAERYYRGATADTPFTSWSVAKSILSLLVGIARDQHRVGDLATPLGRYAPELGESDYGKVPMHDALTMSSGIHFSEDYDDQLSDVYTMFARIFYLHESVGHYLASRHAEAAPGTRFHYASSDSLALGFALRHAVGMPLTSYLEEKLWKPLGMEFDASWNVESDDGAELSFCCLNARLRDYAKIGRLAARHGDWDGQRIVSADWLAESTRVEPARAPGTLPHLRWGYQYQWWIPAGGRGAFMAVGVWGQYIYVNPDRGLVIVKTSVDPDFMTNDDESVALFEAIDDTL